jgi:hypothetical protein
MLDLSSTGSEPALTVEPDGDVGTVAIDAAAGLTEDVTQDGVWDILAYDPGDRTACCGSTVGSSSSSGPSRSCDRPAAGPALDPEAAAPEQPAARQPRRASSEGGDLMVDVTDAQQVRLLIADTDDNPVFTDEQIEQFLLLETSIKLAAATALDTRAANEALVSKRIRTLDLQTDGPAVAKALHDLAESLRAQHYTALEDSDSVFETTTLLGIPGFGTSWNPELTEG